MNSSSLISRFEHAIVIVQSSAFGGLCGKSSEYQHTTVRLHKNYHAYKLKVENPGLPLIVSVQGGTGTGKSTVFNLIAGREISKTGLERPMTQGPILYSHNAYRELTESDVLLPDYQKKTISLFGTQKRVPGAYQIITTIFHEKEALKEILLFDTPDIDSVLHPNRAMAEDIFVFSDLAIFVTSQEKYGDRIPFEMFKQAIEESKQFIVVMNKVEASETALEFRERLQEISGSQFDESKFYEIPWKATNATLQGAKDLHEKLLRIFSKNNIRGLRETEINNLEKRLLRYGKNILSIFKAEREIANNLTGKLQHIHREKEGKLLEEASGPLDQTAKQHIQAEVSEIFRRYDLLRKPRSIISRIVKFPLIAVGLMSRRNKEKRKKDLRKLHRKIDLTSLHAVIAEYNRDAHKLIKTVDAKPLQELLLEQQLSLSPEEIEGNFFKEQEKLESWLQEQFIELTNGIPRHKEWGIYSTTILWGLFLISLESIIGGGLNVFEALLDSVIMPFVSQGAVEIFAYQELKRLAGQLDRRYKEQLKRVLLAQHTRYIKAIESLTMAEDTLRELEKTLSPEAS